MKKEALDQAGTKIVVIGCGEWNPIDQYYGPCLHIHYNSILPFSIAEITKFQGPIYADPTRQVYRALGMNLETLAQTPAGQPKRSYLTSGNITNIVRSIWVRISYFIS